MSVVHAFIFLFSLLGKYTIDPNEGCSSDAVEVYCDFEKQATCVNPKKSKARDLINLLLLCDCSTLLLLLFIVVGNMFCSHECSTLNFNRVLSPPTKPDLDNGQTRTNR